MSFGIVCFYCIAPVRDAIDRQTVQLDLSAIEKWSQENHLPLCTE